MATNEVESARVFADAIAELYGYRAGDDGLVAMIESDRESVRRAALEEVIDGVRARADAMAAGSLHRFALLELAQDMAKALDRSDPDGNG